MTSYFDQANLYIENQIGKDCSIVEESIEDLIDFYSFSYQSRKYLKTGKIEDLLVGQGPIFIDKINKRIFTYGSGTRFDEALKELRKKNTQELEIQKNIKDFNIQKKYDLKISEVSKKQILVDTLLKNKLSYIIPETIGSSIYRIPSIYKKKLLFEKLNMLPLKFHGINQNMLPELIIELIKNSSCQFEIIECKEKILDKSNNKNLDPIW